MPPIYHDDPHHDPLLLFSERLQAAVGERRFQNYFTGKTGFQFDGRELTVQVASSYLAAWCQRQFQTSLLRVAAEVFGPHVTLRWDVDATLSGVTAPATPVLVNVADPPRSEPSGKSATVTRATVTPRVGTRPLKNLAQFVSGHSNELAYSAARQIAEHRGEQPSPLYIHASVGNGKTHLLEGITQELRKHSTGARIVWLTAENFANYYTQALDARSLPGFRQRFRNADVLLVDDIDFLDGKRGIQEEFLHTVKSLEGAGQQLVLTADRHPRLLTRTSDELVTRFLSGIVCPIDAPDLATRTAIVRQLAIRTELLIGDEVVDSIAGRFRNNVRELEGALNSLKTWQRMSGKRVTLSAARELLSRLERDCLKIIRLADIEQAVCAVFSLTPVELKAPGRNQTIAQPRMLAMFLARRLTQAPYQEIGKYFCRNHSTVMSAERKVAREMETQTTVRLAATSWSWHDLVQMLEHRIRSA